MNDIHPTAIIHPGARIGAGTRVGPYSVIGDGVSLGRDNEVGPHVVLEGETRLGDRNRLFQFCAIGAAPQDMAGGGAVQTVIGNDNIIREFVSIHGGAAGTRIGSRNLLMTGSHVAHDCHLGDEVRMASGATLGGHVQIEDAAWLGGLCAVHQHGRVGALAFVAGGAMVTQDVPPYCLVQGDRARLVSLNLVGLKRAGLSAETILRLRRAYGGLFRSTDTLSERIAAVRAAFPTDVHVARMVAFVEGSSRGVMASRRRAFGRVG